VFKRLLIIVVGLVVLVGCAKPPVNNLEETRRIINYLQVSGASQLAADEYLAAVEALRKAELLVKQGDHHEAQEALAQARELSSRALSLSDQRKHRLAEEQKILAEKKAKEAAERKAIVEKLPPELKKPIKIPIPPLVAKPVPEPEPELEPQPVNHVEVGEEETLASISARKEVYQDPSLWPLIYKANRDQIKDPRQIFPGQILLIPRDKSSEEMDAARLEAKELNLF
jgi:nucleoid-associated protein YgaU